MKVLVLGSGVIGVTSAYQLALAGHEVTVVDRQPAAALETSLRQCRRGLARLLGAVGRARRADQGDQVAADAAPAAGDPAEHRSRADPLGPGDAAQLHLGALRDQQEPHGAPGRIQPRLPEGAARRRPASATTSACRARCSCFAPRRSSTAPRPTSTILKRYGVAYEVLDRDGCIRHEPALAHVRDKFVGGLRLPGDETGDCFKFTQNLAALAVQHGVTFRYGTRIDALKLAGKQIDGVVTDAGTLKADAYLVALGSYSPLLLRRSASAFRSTRSRATRSRCRSPTPAARPNRP